MLMHHPHVRGNVASRPQVQKDAERGGTVAIN
jgi:hypothetical protein